MSAMDDIIKGTTSLTTSTLPSAVSAATQTASTTPTAHEPQTLAAEQDATPCVPTGKNFLDLPGEIHLEIYSYFTHIPPRPSEAAAVLKQKTPPSQEFATLNRDRDNVIKARYALQLVCKQLNREWSPIFFSTTTIIANKVVRETPSQRSGRAIHLKLTAKSFKVFMGKSLSPPNMQSLQKLYCNVTHQVRPNFGVIMNRPRAVDFVNAFAKDVGRLPALREITFAGQGRKCSRPGPPSQNPMEWLWRGSLSYEFMWQGMKAALYSDLRTATSVDWSVLRRMHFTKCGLECVCYTPWINQMQPGTTHLYVDEAQVVFRREASVVARAEGGWVEIVGY